MTIIMQASCADIRYSAPRSAYTLLEVILVLAILAMIAAIVTPNVGEAFLRQKLNGAADHLRTEWDKARLTAMKTVRSNPSHARLVIALILLPRT